MEKIKARYSRERPLSILVFFSAMGSGAGHIQEDAILQLRQQDFNNNQSEARISMNEAKN